MICDTFNCCSSCFVFWFFSLPCGTTDVFLKMNACSFQVNGIDRHLHQLTEQTKISPNMKEPRLRVVSYYRWGKKAGKTNPHVRDWRQATRGALPSSLVFSKYRASVRVFCRLSLPPRNKIRDYAQFRKDHCLANRTQRMGSGGFTPWK